MVPVDIGSNIIYYLWGILNDKKISNRRRVHVVYKTPRDKKHVDFECHSVSRHTFLKSKGGSSTLSYFLSLKKYLFCLCFGINR